MRLSQVIIFVTSLFISATAWSEALNLPESLPTLNATPTEKLGTLAKGTGLKSGTQISNFESHNHLGNPVSFEQLKAQAPLMIVFYRGGWCPYCNRQIRQITETWTEFQKRNVTPVLISADKPDAAALAAKTYEIPFPVLSDPDLVIHDQFNVTMKVEDNLIPKYKKHGIDLEQWSGKDHHKIAVSSVFLIDKEGRVVWAHSSMDYKTRPSINQLLRVIDSAL